MLRFLAYQITNLETGARYIGITSRPLERRWKDHCASNDTVIGRAIRKYGRGSFSMEAIACASSYDDLKELEKLLIRQEGTRTTRGGYNVTEGGDGTLGWIPSDETREKIRASNIAFMADPARRQHLSELATKQWSTPEARAIISQANKGRVHTEETRRKVSEAGKRRPPRSQETKEKLAAALRGKVRPPEVRAKIAASRIAKGYGWSAEQRAAMSKARKGVKNPKVADAMRKYHAKRREECAAL